MSKSVSSSSSKTTSSSGLILYSYWRSSCSWRVRAVLEHKGIPYEYRPVSLFTNEQHSESYRRVNPAGFVPTLLIPKKSNNSTNEQQYETLFESLAIIDYLESKYPTPSIYPTQSSNDDDLAVARAKVVAIVEMIVSGIQPLQNLGVMYKAAEYAGGDKSKAMEWNRYWITKKFDELELMLSMEGYAGTYTVGDEFTLADICLVPQCYNALRCDVDLNRYPTIKRLYEKVRNEVAIERSKPENQIDAK